MLADSLVIRFVVCFSSESAVRPLLPDIAIDECEPEDDLESSIAHFNILADCCGVARVFLEATDATSSTASFKTTL